MHKGHLSGCCNAITWRCLLQTSVSLLLKPVLCVISIHSQEYHTDTHFLMRNFTLRPIWGIFCVKKSGTTLVQYTYRCHRGLETPFKTTGLSLGWIPASVIGLEDRQGQHLTSSRKVGFPVPYLRVKPNLPVPPISGRPTSPRGGGGGGFNSLVCGLVLRFDGGRNPRKIHLRCKEPVVNTGEGEFRLAIKLISFHPWWWFIAWCWWDSYVNTTSCQVIHHADLWWFKFNLIEEFPAPPAFSAWPMWRGLDVFVIERYHWGNLSWTSDTQKGDQVMVNLYQPSCEYPFLLLHLNIRFCSCRDFSTAQHFHRSYSNIPKNIRQQTCPPKKVHCELPG